LLQPGAGSSLEAHGYVLDPANKAAVIAMVSKKLGVTDPVAANDGYEDYVRRTDRRGFVLVEGLRSIQRFMKFRNPKIGDIQLERLIDDSLLRELEKSGFSTRPCTAKARDYLSAAIMRVVANSVATR
jgi:hypothetical protein